MSIGLVCQSLHGIQGQTSIRAGAGHLVDGEAICKASPQLGLVGTGAGDVVGHLDDAYVDALSPQPFGTETEMQHIPCVVTDGEE